jgi:hypothetical protein
MSGHYKPHRELVVEIQLGDKQLAEIAEAWMDAVCSARGLGAGSRLVPIPSKDAERRKGWRDPVRVQRSAPVARLRVLACRVVTRWIAKTSVARTARKFLSCEHC